MGRYTKRGLAILLCALLALGGVTQDLGAASATGLTPLAGTSASRGPSLPPAFPTKGLDWSIAVIRTTMDRYPNPAELGKWGYAVAFFLYGVYLVYRRTHDRRYLDYVRGWIDSHVDASGHIDAEIDSLDFMLPGNLLLVLYRETKEKKYKLAAEEIRDRLNTYPRTSDGGFWHATTKPHQLWLDGLYMSMPFLVRYGKMFHDSRYADKEAAHQLLIYTRHLYDPATGLLFHAYDESGAMPWANPVTHHSSFFWGRSIGWYSMALIIVLHALPRRDPARPRLLAMVRELVAALARYQDPKTGLWYQVVNRPDLPGNWLETSCSCMFAYFIARAVREHYVAPKYESVAAKGYRGILARLVRDPDGSAHIPGICVGTNVGNLAFYLARPQKTDDFHGLGAFLVMNDLLSRVSR